MSWCVRVEGECLPSVEEKVSSFSNCPGNVFMCIIDLCQKKLSEMDKYEARRALELVINEIDKGNDGLFNDQYAVDADFKWSKGRETLDEWKEWERFVKKDSHAFPFKDYESYCGYSMRTRCREDAVRFFLYYKAGYNVSFVW